MTHPTQFLAKQVAVLATLFLLTHPASAAFVAFEAESGTRGADFTNGTSGAVQFISIATTNVNSGNPGSTNRVATYTVTFPAAGTYNLFARMRVGSGGAVDDSMFYGNGFGVKSASTDSDWILVNGLWSGGFTVSTDVVAGNGSAGNLVWKWVNLSQFNPSGSGTETPITFTVPAGNLTQTFQIGARENGLDFDRFVFGSADYTFTVADLDNGGSGSPPLCTVNWSDTRQRIDGFGFSSAWCGTLSAAKNQALYGTLGMTLLRIRIDQNNYWTEETANSAAAHAYGAKVFGCPWRAPAYMTYTVTNITPTTTNIFTYLSTNYFNSYALWLGQAATNINLDYVSVKNEPDLYASGDLNMSAEEIRIFCRSNAPAIGRPVTMADAVGFTDSVSDPTLNDPLAATNVAIVSGHFYGNGNYAHTNALAKGKPVWMTEHYLDGCRDNFAVCLNLAAEINNSMKNQFSAYVAWWVQDGDTNINLVHQNGIIFKDGYTMGQFSKFIRPGYYRVGATNTGAGLEITAYKDTVSSNYVIVAINRGNAPIMQQFNLTGFPNSAVTPWRTSYTESLAAQAPVTNVSSTFTYSIQPSNIVTFVGTPPVAAPAGLIATAGKSKVDLRWSAVAGATSYTVKRATASGGPYTNVGSISATNYSDAGLAAATTYYYVVSAFKGAGQSPDSLEAGATTPLVYAMGPLADSYVESSTPGSNYGTSTNMLVKNNVTLATRSAYLMFDVRGLTNLLSATVTLVPNRVDDTAVKMYYELASTNWTETGITWNTQPGGLGVFLATNTLSVGVPVVLDVTGAAASRATNGGLLSLRITQPTNSLNGLIQFCPREHPTASWRPVLEYAVPGDTNVVVPPAAPTGLTATVSSTSVSLTWTASSGATNYYVKRSVVSGSGYTILSDAAGTNFLDTGLVYGTYYYVVSALNAGGESLNSSEASATITALPSPKAVTNLIGASVTIGSNGVYRVTFDSPEWTFTGSLAQSLTNMVVNTGTDSIGSYSEITFSYTSAVPHSAGIRLYDNSPVVTFNDTRLATGANDQAFPQWSSYPSVPNHLSFGNIFTTYNFSTLFGDNLWLYFQTNYDAFIISAATNYMVANTRNSGGTILCGINTAITQLPSGFTHRVILTAQNGINRIYSTWGDALLELGGKTPPANDAVVELNKLGYWTDNGAAYYPYWNGTAPGIANTLLSVKAEYGSKGVPISYMQLDSWWYKKGPAQAWNATDFGFYLYEPDLYIFPDGLAAFQQQLGLPLITHNRWVDTNSPYITVSNFAASGGVMIEPVFWTNIMEYVKGSGVVTYEQDWLGYRGIPNMNLNDPSAYLNNMAGAAAAKGINLQYCMVEGRDYLQGTFYTNLMTIRTSEDRFDTTRWAQHLYGSRLAQAMGIWPWTDVYMSSETRNLLISTLSAGPVGPGDALGTVNAANLLKSVRPDGVIVKPDVPLAPVDDAYVNDALGQRRPMVATTYTEFTNCRALYVFAYAEDPGNLTSSFRPADFGLTNIAYVYDFFGETGTVVSAGGTFNFTTTTSNVFTGGSYFIAAPIGASGVALIGDPDKFVTLGKKRISQLADNGTLTATVKFAAGEQAVTLLGHSPNYPSVAFSQGSGGVISYNLGTGLFTARVVPDGTSTAVVQIGSNGTPPPAPPAPTALAAQPAGTSQINLSWQPSSGASGYNVKRGISSGGPYTNLAISFGTSYTDTGLVAGTAYYYVVSAFNGGGESANSVEAGASTVPIYTMLPVADAYVRDGSSSNSNFGSDVNLSVKYDGNVGSGFNRFTYLKFNVQAQTNVQNVKLVLTPSQVDGAVPLAYEAWSNDNWDETTITWNNQPAGSGATITNFSVYALWTPFALDVTGAVASQATNDGILTIRVSQPGANGTRIDFCSREHPTNSFRPVLQYTLINNTAPVLAAINDRSVGVGVTLSLTNSVTDNDVPQQALTFSLLSAPPNAAIDPGTGVLTWRPLVTQANTTNQFTVNVADNGMPSMSATQSFTVTVSPLAQPQLSAASLSGGRLVLQVNGAGGPDYQIQASTNLADWSLVYTINSPVMPFSWTNSSTGAPVNFFRIQAGPPF